jgi:hypothetical protein
MAVFVRSKHMVPIRHCVSAELKKESRLVKEQVPQRVRDYRKVLHRKKSRELLESQHQESKQMPLLLQAQRLAYEARTQSAAGVTEVGRGKPFFAL